MFFQETIAPTLLGAFLRRTEFTDDKKYIFTYFSFRGSKYYNISEEELKQYRQQYCDSLNSHSGKFPFWELNEENDRIPKKFQGVFVLENDMDLTNDENQNINNFTNLLVLKIYKEKWLVDKSYKEERLDFLRGFFDTASSFDIEYLLASRCMYSDSSDAHFSVRYVYDGYVASSYLGYGSSSNFYEYSYSRGVRPVVYLRSTVQTTGKHESGAWIIKE